MEGQLNYAEDYDNDKQKLKVKNYASITQLKTFCSVFFINNSSSSPKAESAEIKRSALLIGGA